MKAKVIILLIITIALPLYSCSSKTLDIKDYSDSEIGDIYNSIEEDTKSIKNDYQKPKLLGLIKKNDNYELSYEINNQKCMIWTFDKKKKLIKVKMGNVENKSLKYQDNAVILGSIHVANIPLGFDQQELRASSNFMASCDEDDKLSIKTEKRSLTYIKDVDAQTITIKINNLK